MPTVTRTRTKLTGVSNETPRRLDTDKQRVGEAVVAYNRLRHPQQPAVLVRNPKRDGFVAQWLRQADQVISAASLPFDALALWAEAVGLHAADSNLNGSKGKAYGLDTLTRLDRQGSTIDAAVAALTKSASGPFGAMPEYDFAEATR